MALSERQIKALESIRDEWNRAEHAIKLAEQVCNEIVFPSINELRYAGRRLIDLIHGTLTGIDEQKLDAILADTLFACHRARHDAVDTATSKIAIQIDLMTTLLQYEAILPAFPEFPSLVSDLTKLSAPIAISRKERENREAIYLTLLAVDFPELVAKYRRLLACEAIIKQVAARNRQRDFFGRWGFILALIALVAAVVFFFLGRLPLPG